MVKHKQPTKQELDDQIEATKEELDKQEQEDVETEAESDDSDVETEAEEKDEESEEEVKDEKVEEESGEKVKTEDSPNYKKKFVDSSRENQKIYAKNRKLNEAIDVAGDIKEPTDKEMKKEYGDWEDMSDFEKKMAKDSIISSRRFEMIEKASEEGKKIDKWNEKVDGFIEDPQTLIDTPELEGKQEEFKIFATEETNNSVSFKVLVSAFLHEQSKSKVKNKGKMFPTGSGGPAKKSKPKLLTVDQGRALMKSNYSEYKKKLLAGKIESGA